TERRCPGPHVVAHDRRDLEAVHPERGCGRLHRTTRGDRVDAAGVGDEPRATVEHERQRRLEVERQVTREAEALVALTVLLQDRQRELGQRLAHEVVHPGLEQVRDRRDTVAVEALAPSQANRHGVDDAGGQVIPAGAWPTSHSARFSSCSTRWRNSGGGLVARKVRYSGMAPAASCLPYRSTQ